MYTKRLWKQYTRIAQIMPNLPTAYLAAMLEKLGYEVRIIDAFAHRYSLAEVVREILRFKPDVLCYNLITENCLNTINWISEIKKAISVPVIVGGLHMTIYPEETLTHGAIDFGVTGEGWKTLPRLLQAIENKENNYSGIKGICYREEGKFIRTSEREDTIRLEEVPFPARHLLPNEKYTTIMTKEWPITVMISALGCPFRCAYCDVPIGRYQCRSAEHVVAEMEECVKKYGIREIWFQDESFTINEKRVYKICDLIRRRGIKVRWSIRTRADLVSREMLMEMARSGCKKIHYGIESADLDILKALNRNISLENIREAIHWTKEAGIMRLGFYMIGLPGETEESIRKTIQLAIELDCEYIQVNKLIPCPPSPLYERFVNETGIDCWREYTLGNIEILEKMEGYFSNLKAEELDWWQRKFFREYYYRPSYILRRLSEIRSFKEFFGLFLSAWSIR
jgi:anaerobic magnesium-protoporphyrin IX monomethyl ester cyclase